jgi:hypothetical protein
MSNEAMANMANEAAQYDKQIIDELSAGAKTPESDMMISKLDVAMKNNKEVASYLDSLGDSDGSTPPPPPSGFEPVGYETKEYGVVSRDGMTNKFKVQAGVLGILTIPIPADAKPGSNEVALFESGSPPTFMRAWLSKTKGDTSGNQNPLNYQTTQGPHFYGNIGSPGTPFAVEQHPGETWYVMFTLQEPFPPYEPTVAEGVDWNLGVRYYPTV